MLHQSGLEVLIKSTQSGLHFTEHDSPRLPVDDTGLTAQRFIQSVNGEQFEIIINCHPSFKRGNSNAAKISVTLDDGKLWWCVVPIPRIRDSPVEIEAWDSHTFLEGGVWKTGKLAFTNTIKNEDIFAADAEEAALVSKSRGRIDVELQIGRWYWRNDNQWPAENGEMQVDDSLKMIEDNGIQHSISALESSVVENDVDKRIRDLKNAKRDSYGFTFLYRPKGVLQKLGVVPGPAAAEVKVAEAKKRKRHEEEKERLEMRLEELRIKRRLLELKDEEREEEVIVVDD